MPHIRVEVAPVRDGEDRGATCVVRRYHDRGETRPVLAQVPVCTPILGLDPLQAMEEGQPALRGRTLRKQHPDVLGHGRVLRRHGPSEASVRKHLVMPYTRTSTPLVRGFFQERWDAPSGPRSHSPPPSPPQPQARDNSRPVGFGGTGIGFGVDFGVGLGVGGSVGGSCSGVTAGVAVIGDCVTWAMPVGCAAGFTDAAPVPHAATAMLRSASSTLLGAVTVAFLLPLDAFSWTLRLPAGLERRALQPLADQPQAAGRVEAFPVACR